MKKLIRRILYLWNRRRHELDLADEMAAHRDLADETAARHGTTGAAFGNTLRLREESRDAWGFAWLDHLLQDLRYAVRGLRHSPSFTLTALFILTLGIGLNMALFQLVNATSLRPLAVKDPSTLVRFLYESKQMSSSVMPSAGAGFFAERLGSISALLMQTPRDVVWGDDASDRLPAAFVSANWFRELGYGAALGRVFEEGVDDAPGAPPTAVLSDSFWRTRLSADSTIIGRVVRVNNRPVTVIGVAPPEFPGVRLRQQRLWLPVTQLAYFNGGEDYVDTYARVRPGVSTEALRAETHDLMGEASAVVRGFDKDGWLEPYYATARFERDDERDERVTITALVSGLTILVLLVACANLSNLLLSRAVGRLRELSVRAALGASRWRVIRQLLTECLVLASIGAAAGVFVGVLTAQAIASVIQLPSFLDLSPDARTLAAAVAVTLFTVLAVGLVPAWKISRQDLASAMKDGGQQTSASLHRARWRQMLVAAQIAGSCLLLIVAGLMAQSLRQVLTTGPGFEFENVAVLNANLAQYKIAGPASVSFWEQVTRGAAALPEAEGVALASFSPLGEGWGSSRYPQSRELLIVNERVSPAFLPLMRIPIVAGRNFVADDDPAAVVIVSRRVAMRMFGTLDVIGQTYPNRATIVGVAEDAHLTDLQTPDAATMYSPLRPFDYDYVQLIVRARNDPQRLLAPLRGVARSADNRVLAEARRMEADFDAKLRTPRLASSLSGALAILALSLACLGVFGVVSYGAALRTKEIGIRMALGAPRTAVLKILLRQTVWPLLLGAIAGSAAAIPVARLMQRDPLYLLPFNVWALAIAVGFLTAAAGLAALLPALRALRSDPLHALRYE